MTPTSPIKNSENSNSSEHAEHPVAHQPKVALVTGGAKRIGRALCIALARAGYDVAVHYGRSQVQAEQLVTELEVLNVRACALQADLADAASVGTLLARASAQLGTVGVLVNNASLFEYDALTQDVPLDVNLFEQHWRTNTFAPMALSQQLFKQLPADAQGVIINLLDQKLYNPNPDYLSYTLSKSALKEATILAAQALAPRVRVVGIAPGLSLPSPTLSDERFAELHNLSPLGRSSTPADIAKTLIFVIENRAITGTTILVDGGQHLMRFDRDFSVML